MNTDQYSRLEELIVRSLQNRTTPAEEEWLQEWRQASLINDKRYREVSRLWNLTAAAAPFYSSTALPPTQSILDRARSTAPTPSRNPAWSTRPTGSLAAAAVAAAILVGLGMGYKLLDRPQELQFGAAEFITGSTDMVTARLSDGTVVRLAPESRLRTTGSGREREVWLEGQAFFAVAKDERRPFTVRTRLGDALVLGTRFDVQVAQQDLRVVVVEGRVALAAGEEVVQLGAGEMSQVATGGSVAVIRGVDIDPLLAWTGPFLVFQSTPLHQVATEIERKYGVRVDLPDSSLAEQTVTAWFADQSVQEVLAVVCRIVDAHCTIGDSVASIAP